MTEQKARTLASARDGDVIRTMSSWGVAMTKADGRYVLIKERRSCRPPVPARRREGQVDGDDLRMPISPMRPRGLPMPY